VAKPDCDDGWYPMSIELGAALDFADFTAYARTILRYVFGQIFGRGRRPKYAVIKCPKIAKRTGIPVQHLYRSLSELAVSGALEAVEGKPNTYRFVKDYQKWTGCRREGNAQVSTGEPRLTKAQRDDCVASVDFSHGHQLPTIKQASYTQTGNPHLGSGQEFMNPNGEFSSPEWVKISDLPSYLEKEREREEKRVTGSTTSRELATTTDSLPAVIETPPVALHAFMLEQGASPEMAAHAVRELASFTAQGFGVKTVKRAIHRAIRRDKHRDPGAFSRFLRDEIDPPAILPPSPVVPGQRLTPAQKMTEHIRTQYAAAKANRARRESENAGQ
jgi:hypothetical protein